MKTTTLTQDDLTGKAQITYKSGARLTELNGQIGEATQALSAVQAEIQRLTQVSTERKERLEALKNAAQQAETELQEGYHDAKAALGTLNERQEAKRARDLEKRSRTAQNELLKAQEKDAQVSPQESEQLHQLQAQVETLQSDIVGYRQAQEETRGVHTRALRKLGEGYYQDAIGRIEVLQRTVEQAKQALLDAELALERYLEEAMAKLAEEWPDLAQKLWPYLPAPDDATLRVMQACLNYMDQLLADRQQLKPTLPEVPELARTMRWWEALEVGHDIFYGTQQLNTTSSSHQGLQNKRDFVARLIDVYEVALRGRI